MRRREFITLVVGAAAWPITVHAQQALKISRIGVLMPGRSDQSDVSLTILNAFIPALGELGYSEGQNVVIERKFAEWDADKLRRMATELVERQVDVIVASSSPAAPSRRPKRFPLSQ